MCGVCGVFGVAGAEREHRQRVAVRRLGLDSGSDSAAVLAVSTAVSTAVSRVLAVSSATLLPASLSTGSCLSI